MNNLDQPLVTNTPSWPTAIRYGLIWSAIGFSLTLIGFIANMDPSLPTTSTLIRTIFSLLGFGVAIWAITAVISKIRSEQGGFIEYGACVTLGLKTGLIASVVSAFLNLFYTQFINTDFAENMVEAMRTDLENKGQTEDQIDQAIAISSMFTGPIPTLIFIIIFTMVFTLIISLIVGAIMKKSPYPQ
ncbi:MAG: hypothetical protein RIR11_3346 [Bacteroidota bacterium]|jgi:hypothetical protein